MPKALFQIKDFSGGLNDLKDSADIADNELQECFNLQVVTQGSLIPKYSFTTQDSLATKSSVTGAEYNNETTIDHDGANKNVGVGMTITGTGIPSSTTVASVESNSSFTISQATTGGARTGQTLTVDLGIDELEPNYGLGFFETDHGLSETSLTLTADHSPCSHPSRSCDSTGGFRVSGATLSGITGGSAVNLTSTFPIGVRILVIVPTAASNALTVTSSGIYTIVAHSGNNVIVDRSFNVNAGTHGINYATATVSSHPLGDNVTLLADPATHKVHIHSSDEGRFFANQITLRSSYSGNPSRVKYYKVDDSIRVCDTAPKTDCKIQWFGWISRRHFLNNNRDTETNAFLGYFAKDNTLDPPTELTVTAVNDSASGAVCDVTSVGTGAGFAMHITSENDETGTISGTTYEFAQTFIYDGNQESLPVAMDDTLTPVNDLKTLNISIGTKGPFDPRISGGRIYIREAETNDDYTMLVDIDLAKGCRTKFTDDYTSWFDNGSATAATYLCPTNSASANFRVRELNLLTYEIINGFSSNIFSHTIGDQGENWQDAVVANNRSFVCNVTIKDENTGLTKDTAALTTFPDRIMYSMPNRYDTFPYHNFIETAKGDAETYVAIESFADRLLAYKQNSLDIINISSPDDSNWFLEESRKHMGVANPSCVQKTQYGIVWVNKQGFFIYNGSKIVNISENKLDDLNFKNINTDNSSLVYDEVESTIYFTKNSASDALGFILDLKKGTLVSSNDVLPVSNDGFSNSINTQNFPMVASDEGDHIDIYKLNRVRGAHTAIFQTKDYDFGDPTATKRIYAIYITYKSSDVLTGYFTIEEPDGTSHSLAGTVSASASNYSVVKLAPNSACDVSKASIKMDTGVNTRTIYINDISIQYRVLKKRTA